MTDPRVTDTELEVLKVLWRSGTSSIRDITDALYPDGNVAHYATVQKLLDRLRAKGCVRRVRQGRSHIYSAAIDRSDLITRSLEDTAEKLCGGSFTPLLTHLIGGRRLDKDEVDALKNLVRKLEEGS